MIRAPAAGFITLRLGRRRPHTSASFSRRLTFLPLPHTQVTGSTGHRTTWCISRSHLRLTRETCADSIAMSESAYGRCVFYWAIERVGYPRALMRIIAFPHRTSGSRMASQGPLTDPIVGGPPRHCGAGGTWRSCSVGGTGKDLPSCRSSREQRALVPLPVEALARRGRAPRSPTQDEVPSCRSAAVARWRTPPHLSPWCMSRSLPPAGVRSHWRVRRKLPSRSVGFSVSRTWA